jgi:hypothetical protein
VGILGVAVAAMMATACASPQKVQVGGSQYRVVQRDGEEYLCRNETVTGSRVSTTEVCRTRRQIEEAQEDVRRLQTPAFDVDVPDGAPGAY